MRTRVIAAVSVGLALAATAVAASAQLDVHGDLRLVIADNAIDPASAVWVAPDGSRTPMCGHAVASESRVTCSLASWNRGAGDYRIETSAADRLHASDALPVRTHLSGSELALSLHVRPGHVHTAVLQAAPDALQIARAPSSLRSASCRFVIRNDGPTDARASVDAWVEARGAVSRDWISHQGPVVTLAPGEQRCLSVHPDGATPRLTDVAVYFEAQYVCGYLGSHSGTRVVRVSAR